MSVFTCLHLWLCMKATFHLECETNTIKKSNKYPRYLKIKKECKFATNKHIGSSFTD